MSKFCTKRIEGTSSMIHVSDFITSEDLGRLVSSDGEDA